MKKTLALICTGTMVLGMLSGCGSAAPAASAAATSSAASEMTSSAASAASGSTSAQTGSATAAGDRTTLTVGFDANFPPYGYSDNNGGYTGFDLELAQAVCDMEGWKLVKQPIDWDAKDMELSSGTIDCIWNGFTINGREDQYTWSDPYVDNSQVYVVASDSGIAKPADLAGKTVGVQKDSSALAALNDPANAELLASFGNLTQYDDYNTAFMDLEAGAIDCVAMDIGVANYQIKSRGDSFKMLDDQLSTEQYGIGFKKGNEALRDQIQADLYKLYDDGTVKKIAEKYADYGLPNALCMDKYEK